MDIYINSHVEDTKKILIECDFIIKRKKNHFSAMKYVKGGRYHILFEFIDSKTFCDFHFDNTFHLIGTGADYGKKPKLDKRNISYKTKEVNWFTRRNKAIITGFRL